MNISYYQKVAYHREPKNEAKIWHTVDKGTPYFPHPENGKKDP